VRDPPSASLYPLGPDNGGKDVSGSPPSQKPLTILLIEDNETDRLVMQEILEQCGIDFKLCTAVNGSEAIEYIKHIGVDESAPCPGLVLLDLNLPGISGIEVLKQIRNTTRYDGVPVVIVTSSDSEDDRGATARLSVNAYFRKPTSLPEYLELARVIHQVLEQGKS
jgi:CheY-like chemotaxis protein